VCARVGDLAAQTIDLAVAAAFGRAEVGEEVRGALGCVGGGVWSLGDGRVCDWVLVELARRYLFLCVDM